MNTAVETTFRILQKTDNEAALSVLFAALKSPYPKVRDEAFRSILIRRSPAGHREILRRFHRLDPHWKEVLREHRGRMTGTLRDAVLGSDQQMCRNGCEAAVWFREYDLVPTLLTATEDQNNPNRDLAAATLLQLTQCLYDDLANPRQYRDRRDPQTIRQHVIGALELSVQRFAQHRRREVIEAFLILINRDNVTLKKLLSDPHHVAFVVVIDVLTKNTHGGILRLLLSFLDDPRVPGAALNVIAGRSDLRFVEYFLRKIGREPSNNVTINLKRMRTISWLREGDAILDRLDDAAQHGAVRLVMLSAIPRVRAYSVIEYALRHGKAAGRRAASAALAEFNGTEANNLALSALEDPDPAVQANIVSQLRRRGIPGMLPKLVGLVDSPHAMVRKAARENLTEFSFKRFLGAFDMLDEAVRQSTGMLVKKIDPQTVPLLLEELRSQARTRRLRGLAMARSIDVVDQVESQLITMLDDKDHLVRAEAAAILGRSDSQNSQAALKDALADQSKTVQHAAQRSLQERNALAQWREEYYDPRD